MSRLYEFACERFSLVRFNAVLERMELQGNIPSSSLYSYISFRRILKVLYSMQPINKTQDIIDRPVIHPPIPLPQGTSSKASHRVVLLLPASRRVFVFEDNPPINYVARHILQATGRQRSTPALGWLNGPTNEATKRAAAPAFLVYILQSPESVWTD
jgi:hypothetical protein